MGGCPEKGGQSEAISISFATFFLQISETKKCHKKGKIKSLGYFIPPLYTQTFQILFSHKNLLSCGPLHAIKCCIYSAAFNSLLTDNYHSERAKKKRSCCIILIYPGHVSFLHGLDNSKRNKLFSSYFPTLLSVDLNYNQMHPVDSLIRLFRDLAVYLARRGLAYSKTWIEFLFPFYFHFQ